MDVDENQKDESQKRNPSSGTTPDRATRKRNLRMITHDYNL